MRCEKCFYSSRHVRDFFKFVVHAYFSDNAEVMMELEGIDLMFSEQKVMPMPIKDYRKCMKQRKDELTNRKGK